MNFSWGSNPSVNLHLKGKKLGSDFESVKPLVQNPKTASMRVATLGDLTGFLRVSSNLLIHKSTNDLWSVSKTADGAFEVNRLFDDDGSPLKG
jgi:hypothetical protein